MSRYDFVLYLSFHILFPFSVSAEQRPHETKVNLQCAADKAIIVQKNIYLDGNPLEESGITPDPTWTKDGMENECFKQKVEQLKSNIKVFSHVCACTFKTWKTLQIHPASSIGVEPERGDRVPSIKRIANGCHQAWHSCNLARTCATVKKQHK